MTNKEFAEQNVIFETACELARTKQTPRQASKFRNERRGLALRFKATAKAHLEEIRMKLVGGGR